MIPTDIQAKYKVYDFEDASSILAEKHPDHFKQVIEVLSDFSFDTNDILTGGGGKSTIANRLDQAFRRFGWVEKKFTLPDIDFQGEVFPQESHKIDCCSGRVVLEIEWNNKNTFYDRDLSNFELLHQNDVIDCAIIITRATELQALFKDLTEKRGLSKTKYVSTTTHHKKLIPLLARRNGGCPVLVFAITDAALDEAEVTS